MEDLFNKVIQADCLEFLKALPNGSVDLVLIDPPYILETKGGKAFKGIKYHKEINAFSNGFSFEVLDEICRVQKIINCYIFCSRRQVAEIINYFEAKECNYDILTWHKTNPPPLIGSSYLPDTEYIIFARGKGAKFKGIYENLRKYYISYTNTIDKNKYKHPTCKPVELLKKYILNSTNENDIVLDCFSGSGSTAIASISLNRRFIGCELNKEYVDISNRRISNIWQEKGGNKAHDTREVKGKQYVLL